jgi:anti-sigma B factor antagonist
VIAYVTSSHQWYIRQVPGPYSSNFEKDDAGVLLRLSGDLDMSCSPQLAEAIGSCILMLPNQLVLDMNGVSFVDSTGLRVLLDGRRLANERGVPLKLRGLPPATRRLLEMTELLDLFELEA